MAWLMHQTGLTDFNGRAQWKRLQIAERVNVDMVVDNIAPFSRDLPPGVPRRLLEAS